jgi:hypothetical protein
VRQNTSFKNSFVWGIAGGLATATVFAGFVGAMALLRGSAWNPTYQVSTWDVIRGYYLAGLLAGVAFGVLRPLFWGRVGGVLLGICLGPVVYGAVATAVEGHPQFASPAAVLIGALVGGVVGWNLSRPGALP